MRVFIKTYAADGTDAFHEVTDRAPVNVVHILRDNPGIQHVTVYHSENGIPDAISVFGLSRSQVRPEYL